MNAFFLFVRQSVCIFLCVPALEEQNRELMQQAGYSIPDTIGKNQPLRPLNLPAGQGEIRRDAYEEQPIQENRRQQLEPLSSEPQQSGMASTMSTIGDLAQRGQTQLKSSFSTPALAAPLSEDMTKGPEFLLKDMLQRGEISFKEYKDQKKKLAEKNYQ